MPQNIVEFESIYVCNAIESIQPARPVGILICTEVTYACMKAVAASDTQMSH